jgi:DNA-binding beta-propeller fold protein YncE
VVSILGTACYNVFAMRLACLLIVALLANAAERHYLYVAEPGIRNYLEYGGIGVLVFDIDDGYKFVKRIPTWETPAGKEPENVKGIAASAATGRLYVTTVNRMAAFDIATGKKIWDRAYPGGCDRMAISPAGKILYVPSLEGAHWNVVNADTGDIVTKVEPRSGSHNTIFSLDGTHVYLAGLRSPFLSVADAKTNTVVKTVGPFSKPIRPFTVNGRGTLVFVNVNDLAGFEVGDVETGKMLHRVEFQDYKPGVLKRHGCPSHGIALTPDERELWVVDGANNSVHVFDATRMPPQQTATIPLRDFPGWISFSIDGRQAYSSTGEIIDTSTRKIVATLTDEKGRAVQSEKLLELVFADGKVIRAGNQFGIGAKR